MFQAGPIERVAIPKDNGKNRMYGFVTYKYQVSVPYALSVFSGTKLFNRELRLNNRHMNRLNENSNALAFTAPNSNNNRNNQNRGGAMEPRPILPNAPLPHQFQMQQQNPFGNAALRGMSMNSMNNSMMPPPMMPRMELSAIPQLDIQTLLQLGSNMMLGNNGLDMNMMGNNSADDSGRRHQSKMMHRHENRSHNQNSNYSRDKDRRNDRRRDRSRSRSRERQNNDNWIRNRGGGGGGGKKNDRNDRDRRGNDKNRRR